MLPTLMSQPLVLATGTLLRTQFKGSLSSIAPPLGDPKTWWFLAPEHVSVFYSYVINGIDNARVCVYFST